jgi:membrane protease YdiL (CAAX protease family)
MGLVLTAIIFGALHAITRLYFVYAVFAGLGLGLLADWQGTLWLPIATHFAVDVLALWFLTRWAGRQRRSHSTTHDFTSKGEPSLLS